MTLRVPFPYPGCKHAVTSLVWSALGDPPNYVEPFAGSAAVLLGRESPGRFETLNDLDCFVVNFFRSMQRRPEVVERFAIWPVSEADLHARHATLVAARMKLGERIVGDPVFCDPKLAAWWAWGASVNLAGAWCDGRGPWRIHRRRLRRLGPPGINRSIPRLTSRSRMSVSGGTWVHALHTRLAGVRITCGDWRRVVKPSVTTSLGLTGIVLDPPYLGTESMYRCDEHCASEVAEWAREHGDDPLLRIVLCGHEGDYRMPRDWRTRRWDRPRHRGKHPRRECLWFSPGCLPL